MQIFDSEKSKERREGGRESKRDECREMHQQSVIEEGWNYSRSPHVNPYMKHPYAIPTPFSSIPESGLKPPYNEGLMEKQLRFQN